MVLAPARTRYLCIDYIRSQLYTPLHYPFLFAISMPWRSLTWDLLQTTVHVKYKMPDLLTLYILCTICVHIDNKNLLEPLFSLNVAFFTGWWQKTCQVVGRHLWAWWKESVSNYNITYNTSRIDLEPLVLCAKHIKHLQVFSLKKISPMFVCSPLHYRGCCKLTVLHTEYWTFINSFIKLNSCTILN